MATDDSIEPAESDEPTDASNEASDAKREGRKKRLITCLIIMLLAAVVAIVFTPLAGFFSG